MIEVEKYGYKQGAKGDFVPVEFIRRGRGKQTRVLIRHLTEEMDSLEEWVPPGRLQVPWADVDQRRLDKAKWRKLTADSRPISEA
ncbi:hypothetical protein [Arthrobacter sp. B0490]|uniref:hypothetical protein n=1 Tax=Arthrobacter sp. B0490 TaxID=2058891 RepID=UPI0011B0D06C|nr:hypothetical protein [Arthrobacter sp. B0490]